MEDIDNSNLKKRNSKIVVKYERVLDVPKEQLKEFKQAFDLFDKHKKGEIGVVDISKAMKNFGYELTKKEIEKMIASLDIDGNGAVDFEEFVSLIQKTYELVECEDDIIEAFKTFDKDNDGVISCQEFQFILGKMGNPYSSNLIKQVLEESKLEPNGKMNYRDFVDFWTNMENLKD